MITIEVGEQKLNMLATAATNLYVKHIFHIDPIAIQSDATSSTSDRVELSQCLAFVMCQQAKAQLDIINGKGTSVRDYMNTLTEDDYIDWLDGLNWMDLNSALEDVMTYYSANSKSSSKAKKE